MRYVAAYLLAVQGGNASPSAADLTSILSSVGIEADAKQMSMVIDNLKGKNLEELIAEGLFLETGFFVVSHVAYLLTYNHFVMRRVVADASLTTIKFICSKILCRCLSRKQCWICLHRDKKLWHFCSFELIGGVLHRHQFIISYRFDQSLTKAFLI